MDWRLRRLSYLLNLKIEICRYSNLQEKHGITINFEDQLDVASKLVPATHSSNGAGDGMKTSLKVIGWLLGLQWLYKSTNAKVHDPHRHSNTTEHGQITQKLKEQEVSFLPMTHFDKLSSPVKFH